MTFGCQQLALLHSSSGKPFLAKLKGVPRRNLGQPRESARTLSTISLKVLVGFDEMDRKAGRMQEMGNGGWVAWRDYVPMIVSGKTQAANINELVRSCVRLESAPRCYTHKSQQEEVHERHQRQWDVIDKLD